MVGGVGVGGFVMRPRRLMGKATGVCEARRAENHNADFADGESSSHVFTSSTKGIPSHLQPIHSPNVNTRPWPLYLRP